MKIMVRLLRSGPGRALAWRMLRGVGVPVIGCDVGTTRIFLHTYDKEISRKIFLGGDFEGTVLQRAVTLLADFGYKLSGRVFLDIGANIGSATLLAMLEHGARGAVAIEPEITNYELLRINLISNLLVEKVSTHRVALSDKIGKAYLEISRDNSGNHYVRTQLTTDELADVIETTTFDELVTTGVIDLSAAGLAWMDVETHELEVLKGAQSLLLTDLPLVIEYWPVALGGKRTELLNLLADNYRSFVDLRNPQSTWQPTTQLRDLAHLTPKGYMISNGSELTDILLIKAKELPHAPGRAGAALQGARRRDQRVPPRRVTSLQVRAVMPFLEQYTWPRRQPLNYPAELQSVRSNFLA